MRRFRVTAWVTVLALSVAGCASGTSEAPPDRADPPAATVSTGATETHEPTTGSPPNKRTAYDPPAVSPHKEAGLFFPQAGPTDDFMTALGGGRLVVRDRCIYMAPGGVVVWPHGYSLRREGGEVLVLSGRDEVVAKVGEEVRMGGGQITREEAGPTPEATGRAFEEKWKELGVPNRCGGPLWVSSGLVGR